MSKKIMLAFVLSLVPLCANLRADEQPQPQKEVVAEAPQEQQTQESTPTEPTDKNVSQDHAAAGCCGTTHEK